MFISQLIRYARACSFYKCFILRAARLSSKVIGQGYVRERLKSFLMKCYGQDGDLIKPYKVFISQTLHDIRVLLLLFIQAIIRHHGTFTNVHSNLKINYKSLYGNIWISKMVIHEYHRW